ncbi:hypothetical protein [Bradyrhizobium yuanmingense]|uniref:hypothetical protein n=1 Tax=Bradyrhizobium yuanmingense TaxID=108015 RepID=UPI0023BA25CE|nr:hypothetical protein [Bradyrhizobium yuanmingense]MDF0583128.1 hypothetical protein [Bradyrhizobium yuanmingense]
MHDAIAIFAFGPKADIVELGVVSVSLPKLAKQPWNGSPRTWVYQPLGCRSPQPQDVPPSPFQEPRLPMKSQAIIKILGDVCISVVIVLVSAACVWSAGSALGIALMFAPGLTGLLFAASAAPFVLLPVYGLAKRRIGFVLTPIILAGMAYGGSSLLKMEEKDLLADLTSYTAEPERKDHTLLAVEDDGNSFCDEVCIKVLATSNHTLALRSNTLRPRSWMLYSQADGATCLAKDNVRLALQFLLWGYPGKCATSRQVAEFEDGLLLRVIASDASRLRKSDLPKGFTGQSYEYYERINGKDRFLARHIKGGLSNRTPFLFLIEKRLPAVDAGPPIDRLSFLANAIGTDIKTLREPAEPFPFDEALIGLEKYFDQKEAIGADTLRLAGSTWLQIASNASRIQPQLLKQHVLRLLTSHDPVRINLGIKAIDRMRLDERIFPDDVMLDLVFAPITEQATISFLEKQLERQFALGRMAPARDVLERARGHSNDPSLKPWQSRILDRINQLQ